MPNEIRPYVFLNGEKVFILLDPCHMLKLLRSTLAIYGTFMAADGVVKWSDLEALQEEQASIGLHLANKLTQRHIQYDNQKMKVGCII